MRFQILKKNKTITYMLLIVHKNPKLMYQKSNQASFIRISKQLTTRRLTQKIF